MRKANTPPVEVVEVNDGDVVDVPTKVAGEYKTGTFFVGQEITVIGKLDIKTDDMLDEDGNALDEEVVKKIQKIQKEINKLIDKKSLVGNIFKIEGDYLLVDFGKEYNFTTDAYPMNVVFPEKKTFFSFHKDLCFYKEGNNDDIATFISTKANKTQERMCLDYSYDMEYLVREEKNIIDYINSINSLKEGIFIRKNKLSIAKEKILNATKVDTGEISDYVKRIKSNPDIKDVSVITVGGEQALLVTTNELRYSDSVSHSSSRNCFNYNFDGVTIENIGAYKFYITQAGTLKATNYTKMLGSRHKHPCISKEFSVCTGSHFGSAFKDAVNNGDFASAIHMMIDFIKDPNSTSPYQDASEFMLAQDFVPEKPVTNELDWFREGTYSSSKFDTTLYKKMYEEKMAELKPPTEVTTETALTTNDVMEIAF